MTRGLHTFARKLRTWIALPLSVKWLSLELAAELARARFQVSFLPLRRYTRDLGTPRPADVRVDPEPDPDPHTRRLLRAVRGLTESLSRVLPWRCTCLVRSLAAFRVLRRRGCHTSLSLGVRRNASELEAHAWLSHGPRIITGREEAPDFAPVAQFNAWDAPR